MSGTAILQGSKDNEVLIRSIGMKVSLNIASRKIFSNNTHNHEFSANTFAYLTNPQSSRGINRMNRINAKSAEINYDKKR